MGLIDDFWYGTTAPHERVPYTDVVGLLSKSAGEYITTGLSIIFFKLGMYHYQINLLMLKLLAPLRLVTVAVVKISQVQIQQQTMCHQILTIPSSHLHVMFSSL
jgi:hypothetical protein